MQLGQPVAEVAESVGMTPSDLQAVEAGRTRATSALLVKIGEALDVEVAHFFGDFEDAFPDLPSTVPNDGSVPTVEEVQRVLNAYVRVRSPSLREGLVRQAEAGAEIQV